MDLPTQREMILNAITALDKARSSLSDARDWLQSDWQPVGLPLAPAAAQAPPQHAWDGGRHQERHRRRQALAL